MTTTELTPAQLRHRGYGALLRELGPIEFVRFMQQFEPGIGDYSRDRHDWLDTLSVDQVHQMIQAQRPHNTTQALNP